MTTAHVDCTSGASGEMWLGALVDAGASLEAIQDAVERLGPGNVRVTVGRVRRAGVDALSVRIRPPQDTAAPTSWPAVRTILEHAGLADGVRDRAHAVFRCLFEMGSRAEGVPVEEVRVTAFAGLDMLGDVVGTCVGVVELGLDDLTSGPVGPGREELVTPLGEALLTVLTRPVDGPPDLDVERVGVGAGTTELAHPHVLRLLLARDVPEPHARPDVAGPRDPDGERTS